ncbi:MAG: hypothetical protein KJ847_04390 [Firmicutes bacterium]|nr:hypothetical protein [Bacillota bacterium]
MFQRKELSVLDWWGFFILMAIPVVNLVILIVLLVSPNANKTLKNYIKAIFLPAVIIIIIIFLLGGLSAFTHIGRIT